MKQEDYNLSILSLLEKGLINFDRSGLTGEDKNKTKKVNGCERRHTNSEYIDIQLKDLKILSGIGDSHLRKIIDKHNVYTEIDMTSPGHPISVRITPENYMHFGLSDYPQKKKEIEEERQVKILEVKVGGAWEMLDSAKDYRQGEVLDVLKRLHPGYFTEDVLGRTIEHLKEKNKGGLIKGEKLIELVKETEDIILLASKRGRRKLEEICGVSYDTLASVLSSEEGKNYVHELPIAPGREYIRLREVTTIASMCKESNS